MPNGQNISEETTKGIGISANTPIIFTVKSFFATIGSLLGLLIGFYFAILSPSIKNTTDTQKELYDKLYEEQKSFIISQFGEVKSSIAANTKAIGINTAAVNATTARFNDLTDAVERLDNSGGSFGDNNNSGGGVIVANSLGENN